MSPRAAFALVVGLLSLLAHKLMGKGGVDDKDITRNITAHPVASGERRWVVLEVESTEEEARGTFTLKLWRQEGRAPGELFDGVTFP